MAQVDWPCRVHRLYQERNFGCDPSEYLSQKWAFSLTDKCIVLEDDDVPADSFFPFCKEMLDRYADDERIGMVAGFNTDERTPDVGADSYFFTTNFSIWGWASWRRVIDRWDASYSFLDRPEAVARIEALTRERPRGGRVGGAGAAGGRRADGGAGARAASAPRLPAHVPRTPRLGEGLL